MILIDQSGMAGSIGFAPTVAKQLVIVESYSTRTRTLYAMKSTLLRRGSAYQPPPPPAPGSDCPARARSRYGCSWQAARGGADPAPPVRSAVAAAPCASSLRHRFRE